MKKFLSITLGVALAIASLSAPVAATTQKVDICHATPPDTAAQGYNELSVDIASSGYVQSGHDDHGKDIIPPYTYYRSGPDFEFPGLNWDATGQRIFNAGCVDGEDGEDGEDGTDGEDGEDGAQGPPGEQGEPGAPGKDGVDGKDGKDGVDGKDGQVIYVEVPVPQVVERIVERIVTPEVYAPDANVTVCGDPRATLTLDNSVSNVPARFKVIFYSGFDGERIVRFKNVAAGAVKVTKPIWVKGGGALLRVRGSFLEPLLVVSVYRGEGVGLGRWGSCA